MGMGDKKDKAATTIFDVYANGLKSNCDVWIYNSSASIVDQNMQIFIGFYKLEMDRYHAANTAEKAADFIDYDDSKINWHSGIVPKLQRGNFELFDEKKKVKSLYRPFHRQWAYYSSFYNQRVSRLPDIFPDQNSENLVICLTLSGTKGFSLLISNVIPDLHLIGDAQCFPLYLYQQQEEKDMFNQDGEVGYQRKDAITNEALDHFQSAYPERIVSKESIFYYAYGLLHSEDFRERYADNLVKQLPRIPRMKTHADFAAVAQAGRDLAALHLNYESIVLNTQATLTGSLKGLKATAQGVKGGDDADFYVTKMKFAKKGDKSRVIYNGKITIDNIPEEAYDYVVNGKPALEWVMERQAVTTDKKSCITNDANDWAIETMGNPRYPLELFLRVITVSLKTQEIVRNLPKLDIL